MGGKAQAYGRAHAGRALDIQFSAVALDHAVDHRETETGAAFALGRKKGLEAAAARIFIHTDTRIADLDQDTNLPAGTR